MRGNTWHPETPGSTDEEATGSHSGVAHGDLEDLRAGLPFDLRPERFTHEIVGD